MILGGNSIVSITKSRLRIMFRMWSLARRVQTRMNTKRLALKSFCLLLMAFAYVGDLAAGDRGVYVIASEPCSICLPRFPTLLFRVDGENLSKIRTVTTQSQGTIFIHAFHDKGYVFVGSEGALKGSFLLDVIDLEAVSTQESYDINMCEDCSFISTNHLQIREGSLIYLVRGAREDQDRYRGVNLKTGRISTDFGVGDEGRAYLVGPGSPFVDTNHSPLNVFDDAREALNNVYDKKSRLGWKAPGELELALGKVAAWQLVNNDQMRTISAREFLDGESRSRKVGYFVFDKAAGSWSRLELPKGYFPLRAHRHWLVTEEFDPEPSIELNFVELAAQFYAPFPSTASRFSMRFGGSVPTGLFRFYNLYTKEMIIHDTDEPYSEVLYVDENDMVYYRVSDELRLAQIEGGKLVHSRVLVKSPEMWAVHWLFLGRE